MGDEAVLAQVADTESVLALAAGLRARIVSAEGIWAQVEEIVPAARTVLIRLRPSTDLEELGQQLQEFAAGADAQAGPETGAPSVTVDVVYDGPDLAEVAGLTGMSAEEVIAAHTGTPWRVAFSGFAPGFAYLVGGDPRLSVPRHGRPRTNVPAGSVGLAAQFTGIYPRSSPGGWQLIGRTDAVLWDSSADPPALLRPGGIVTFRRIEADHTQTGEDR
ncbi:MAG: allophanate hydrolase [Micrococcales bacterium]|nr:MAG: allophanate hydrolase [Micrococcales bacterium]